LANKLVPPYQRQAVAVFQMPDAATQHQSHFSTLLGSGDHHLSAALSQTHAVPMARSVEAGYILTLR
jgi:hypothetical protein